MQQRDERDGIVRVAPQELGRRRRRSRPRVEQHDADFTARERLVEHRQIADHDREEHESDARFHDSQGARQRRRRDDVAEAQREEGRPAHVEGVPHRRDMIEGFQGEAERPLQ